MVRTGGSISFSRSIEFLAQSTIDLRDARCAGLSANRRFECAYDAALCAAASVLGETYTQTRGDLATFEVLDYRIRMDIKAEGQLMVRLRQIEDRRRYEGITSINETDVARAIEWADKVRVGALQYLKSHANVRRAG
jgi:hypothetical protein